MGDTDEIWASIVTNEALNSVSAELNNMYEKLRIVSDEEFEVFDAKALQPLAASITGSVFFSFLEAVPTSLSMLLISAGKTLFKNSKSASAVDCGIITANSSFG